MFSIYTKIFNVNGKKFKKHFIVETNEFGDICKWTNYHKYIKPKEGSITRAQSSLLSKYKSVILFLNYICFEKGINPLSNITKNDVEEYLNKYGMLQLEKDDERTHRKRDTVIIRRNDVIDFLKELIKDGQITRIKESDLTEKIDKYDYRSKKIGTINRTKITIQCVDNYDRIYRDITYKAMDIIMRQIEVKHRNIYMLACLCSYTGLRPSEACNVRRTDSVLGPRHRI